MEKYIAAATECVEHAEKLPKALYKNCSGIILTSSKEFGLAVSALSGSGVMLVRKEDGTFSPPIAVTQQGGGFGATVGAQKKNMVIVLGKHAAEKLTKADFQIKFGVTAGFAAGKIGREVQTEVATSDVGGVGMSYVYCFNEGVMVSVQLENSAIEEVPDVNYSAYGKGMAKDIVEGDIPIPEESKELLEKVEALFAE